MVADLYFRYTRRFCPRAAWFRLVSFGSVPCTVVLPGVSLGGPGNWSFGLPHVLSE